MISAEELKQLLELLEKAEPCGVHPWPMMEICIEDECGKVICTGCTHECLCWNDS